MVEQYFYKNNEAYQKSIKRQQKSIQNRAKEMAKIAASNPDEEYTVEQFAKLFSTGIAGIQSNRVNNLVSAIDTNIYTNSLKRASVNSKDDSGLLNAYEKFFKLAEPLTDKQKSSSDFLMETVESANAFYINNRTRGNSIMKLSDIKQSWDQMKKGQYVVFDFETFGGQNKAGVQILDQLTEYSFDFYDKLGEKSNKRVEGIVGFTSSKANSIINKFLDGVENVSSINMDGEDFLTTEHMSTFDKIQIQSLAKFGDKRTKFANVDHEFNDGRKGRERVIETISNEEAKVTKQNVLRGIRELERIGNTQYVSRVDGMLAWEKDLVDTFLNIQKNGTVKVGHNIPGADMPWANQTIDNMSKSARDYFFNNGGQYLHADDGKTFDLLSLARLADTTGKLSRQINTVDQARDFIAGSEHTALQQETLARAALDPSVWDPKVSGRAAHTASEDTRIFNALLTLGKMPGKGGKEGFVDKLLGMADSYVGKEEVNLDFSVLMNARKGTSNFDHGIVGYTINPDDGIIRTSNNFEIARDGGVSKKGIGDTVIKKDATYILKQEIQKITPGGDVSREALRTLGMHDSRFAQSELYSISLAMFTPEDYLRNKNPKDLTPREKAIVDKGDIRDRLTGHENATERLHTTSTLIGTKEQLQQWIDENMIAYASHNAKTGKFDPINSGMKLVSNYDTKQNKVLKTSIEEVIERGYSAVQHSSSNRAFEEMDYGKISKISSFHKAVQMEKDRRKKLGVDGAGEKWRLDNTSVINYLIEGLKDVSKRESEVDPKKIAKMRKMGNYDITKNEALLHAWDALKVKDFSTGASRIDFRTLDYVRSGFNVMDKSGQMINNMLDIVNSKVDKDGKELSTSEKNFLFKQGMENIYAKWSQSVVDETQSKTHKSANKMYEYVPAHERNKVEFIRSNFMQTGNASSSAYMHEEKTYKFDLSKNPEAKLISEANKTLNMRQDGSIKGRLYDMARDNGIYIKEDPSLSHKQVAEQIVNEIKKIRADDQSAFSPKPVAKFKAQNGIEILNTYQQETIDYMQQYVEKYRPGTVKDMNKIMKDTSEDSGRRKLANDIVEKFMMQEEMDYSKYGYTDEQAKFLSNARDLRKKDYLKYAENILKGVHKSGANLVFDGDRGLLGMEYGGEFVDLSKIVARDKHYNGVSYTEVGGNKIRNGIYVGMFGSEKDTYETSDIKAKSNVGKALSETGRNIQYSVKRAIERGEDPVDAVTRWMKDVNSVLREGPSVDHFDEKDMKGQSYINIKNAIDNLGKIKGVKNLTSENQKELEELIARSMKDNWSHDKMSDSSNMFLQKSIQEVMQFLGSDIDEDFVRDAMKNITARTKSSAAESGYYEGQTMVTEMEDLNKIARQIDRQNSFITYDKEVAENILKSAYDYEGNSLYNRVGLGANMRTNLGAARDEMISDEHRSRRMQTFELLRASYSPQELMQKVSAEFDAVKAETYNPNSGISAEAFEENKEAKLQAMRKLASISNITEGAAVINGRVAEAVMQGSDLQMKSWKKDLFSKDQELFDNFSEDDSDEIKQRLKNVSNMQVSFESAGKDGKFNLSYGEGFAVKHGETILQEYSEYGSKYTNMAAKYDGVAKIGFFTKDKGHLVSATEVSDYLFEEANKKSIRLSSIQEVMEFAKEYYHAAVYVDKLEFADYRKLQEDNLEKHMTAVAMEALGSHDGISKKSVSTVLDNLGLGHLSGKILDRKYFEELKSGEAFEKGVLSSSVDGTKTKFLEAIRTGGFDSEKDFAEHIERERYLAGDMFHKMTGADVALQSDDVGHANTAAPIKSAINNMHDYQVSKIMERDGLTLKNSAVEREASQVVVDALQDAFIRKDGESGLYVNENGRVGITKGFDLLDGQKISIKQLSNVYDNFMPKDSNNPMSGFENLSMMGGHVTKHGYNLMNDVTTFQGTGLTDALARTEETQNKLDMMSGLKMTDRELSLMSTQTYNQEDMNKIRRAFGDDDMFKSTFGHVLNEDFTLKEDAKGQRVMKTYLDEMRRTQYFGAGESMLLDTDGSFKMEADESIKNAARQLQNISGGAVSRESAELLHSVASSRAAIKYNKGTLSHEFLTDGNASVQFKAIDLKDVVTSNGKDSEYVLNHPNSLFNQNLLINLDDEHLHGVTKKLGRSHIAIGMIPASALGDEVLTNDVHAAMNSIIHARQDIIENGALLGEKGIQRRKEDIVNKAQELNKLIDKITHGKNGSWAQLNSVRVNQSAFGKAMLLDTNVAFKEYSKDLLPLLDKVSMGGSKLEDFYSKGVNLDVKVFGMEHAQKMGLFDEDYLKKIGSTKEQVIEQLEKGVHGLTERYPAIYEGSKSTTMFVLDRNLGKQVIESAAGLLTRKGDADGDQPGSELAAYTDKNGRRIDALEYALKGGAANTDFAPEVHDAFRHHEASNVMNAVIRQDYYQNKFDAANKEAAQIYNEVLDKAYLKGNAEISDAARSLMDLSYGDSKKYSDSGMVFGGLSREATGAELAAINADKDELHSRVLNTYARANNVELGSAHSHLLENMGNDFRQNEDYLNIQRSVINETSDDALKHRFEIAARYDDRHADFKAAQMGAQKRGNAGQINLAMAKMNKLRLIAERDLGFEGEDLRMFVHATEAAEEGFLSPKHSSREQVNNPAMMDEFNRAMRAISNNPMAGDEAGGDLMKEWMHKNALGRIRNYESQEDKITALNRSVDMMSEIFSKTKGIASYNTFLQALGQHTNGVGIDNVEASMAGIGKDTFASQTSRALANAYGDLGHSHTDKLEYNERVRQAFDDTSEFRGNSYQPPTVESLRTGATGKLEFLKNAMSKMSGRGLAIGAAGLVGASTIASFVGGNPSKPASNHAASTDGAGGYEPVPLADGGGNYNQVPQGNGYVVNVNAQSGHSREHVQEAIKNAVKNATGGNVNISMTTRNEYSNLTQDSVTSLLANAL